MSGVLSCVGVLVDYVCPILIVVDLIAPVLLRGSACNLENLNLYWEHTTGIEAEGYVDSASEY